MADQIVNVFVREIFADFAEHHLCAEWFFIRYFEDGAHLRVRMKQIDDVAPEKVTYEFARRLESWNLMRPSESMELRWVDYHPEIERYGGTHAIDTAERFFCASSDVVLRVLAHELAPRTAYVQTQAALMMVAMAYEALGSTELAAKFLNDYSIAYARVLSNQKKDGRAPETENSVSGRPNDGFTSAVAAAARRLARAEPMGDTIDHLRSSIILATSELRDIERRGLASSAQGQPVSWRDYVYRVLPSYVHMHNNRMGLSIRDEVYCASVAADALDLTRANAESISAQ